MNKLNYEIARLEDFYNLYQSVPSSVWWKELVLSWYEKKLTILYARKQPPPLRLKGL